MGEQVAVAGGGGGRREEGGRSLTFMSITPVCRSSPTTSYNEHKICTSGVALCMLSTSDV